MMIMKYNNNQPKNNNNPNNNRRDVNSLYVIHVNQLCLRTVFSLDNISKPNGIYII